ncbi:hypothetical protein ABT369_04580 [Dactylosporangium sp. NPDC000244]|uniref:hypothetical protein n=1 Tax=Dactylosporangium sp. NPDC000244 TaxID=3154365 RepID=UPI00331D4083
MKRLGLLCGAAVLTLAGALPPVAAAAQPTPEPSAPSTAGHGDMLKDVLHGEGLVQTKHGPVRVAIQNGDATKVTDTALTVRSSDGFTRTWQLPKDLKVYAKRHTIQPSGIMPGTELTVAGTAPAGTSATWTAKRVVVRSASEPAEPNS